MESKYFNDDYKYNGDYHVKKLYAGLLSDLELLRKTFASENNLSYTAFAKSWVSLKFSSIYGAQSSLLQWLEFTEGALHSAKGYIFTQCLESSIFGIYLIQTLYYKQCLCDLPCKIRMTLNEFTELQNILKQFETAGHFEPIYIFHNLYFENAIQFVAMPLEAGIEIGYKKYFGSIQPSKRPKTSALEPPVDPSILNQFDETLQVYLKSKQAVFKDSALFSTSSNFVSEMEKLISEFGESDFLEEETPDIIASPDKNDIGTERRNLKKYAFFSRPVASSSKYASKQDDDPDAT